MIQVLHVDIIHPKSIQNQKNQNAWEVLSVQQVRRALPVHLDHRAYVRLPVRHHVHRHIQWKEIFWKRKLKKLLFKLPCQTALIQRWNLLWFGIRLLRIEEICLVYHQEYLRLPNPVRIYSVDLEPFWPQSDRIWIHWSPVLGPSFRSDLIFTSFDLNWTHF